MGITPDQLIQRTIRTIEGYRHRDYQHTVEKAIFYNQIVTGKNQEGLIVSYKPRENDHQKQQRINLYHGRTKSAANRVLAVFDKTKQVEKSLDKIEYPEQDDNKLAVINKLVSHYKGPKSVSRYLDTKYRYYNAVDPNAWHIVAEGPTVDDIRKSFPLDIPSHSAYDFEYKDGMLQYLISYEHKRIGTAKGVEFIAEYYGFTAGYVVYMVELNEEVAASGYYPDSELQSTPIPAFATEKVEDKEYKIFIYSTSSTVTPAIRWGYQPDAETNQRTFVGLLDPATEEFSDLINRKSEYDLSLALHTFLQKYQVAEPCDYKDLKGKHPDICRGGKLQLSGHTCPSCKGNGLKIHTTSQDIILVKRTEDKESYIPLSEMAKYIEMPFEIVKHQSEIIDQLPKEISIAIFGVDISQRPNENVTATAIQNFYDSVYAVLADYSDHYSEMYIFTVQQIAQNAGVEEGLIVQHKFPRNFELMSLGEMLGMLKAAKEAGASFEVISNIETDILSKQHQDRPEMLALQKVKDKFKPFKHLSPQEKLLELTSLSQDNVLRILYLYNDLVFSEILKKNKAFLMLPYDRQKEIVEAQAKEIASKVVGEMALGMREIIENQITDEETEPTS